MGYQIPMDTLYFHESKTHVSKLCKAQKMLLLRRLTNMKDQLDQFASPESLSSFDSVGGGGGDAMKWASWRHLESQVPKCTSLRWIDREKTCHPNIRGSQVHICCLIDQICGIFGEATFPVSKSSPQKSLVWNIEMFWANHPKQKPYAFGTWNTFIFHRLKCRWTTPWASSCAKSPVRPIAFRKWCAAGTRSWEEISPAVEFPGPFLNGWFQWKIEKSWEIWKFNEKYIYIWDIHCIYIYIWDIHCKWRLLAGKMMRTLRNCPLPCFITRLYLCGNIGTSKLYNS